MFLNQIIGIINLSLPIVFGYYVAPEHIFRPHGMTLSALVIGGYVAYLSYRQSKSLESVLKYTPTGDHKDRFEQEVRKCGVAPEAVNLRYSYLNDNIATSTLNTVCIDPLVWHGIDEDSDAKQVKDIVERQVLPAVPEHNKKMHEHIKSTLNPHVQDFIFRHELGHTHHAYSKKTIATLFAIAAAATVAGMVTASSLIAAYGGIVALLAGMTVGGITDTLLGYLNNALFKAREEWRADEFAVTFSSAQEIRAAADFFEEYEKAADVCRNSSGLLVSYLPVTAVTGHPEGSVRAAYLREAAHKKESEVAA